MIRVYFRVSFYNVFTVNVLQCSNTTGTINYKNATELHCILVNLNN